MNSPLAGSSSPFLRHGAEQPVAWRVWGADAFEEARASNRPVLLDIGAVWCHWCHVMDRESYEDAETAALINQLFVPVKVDRDERPDVDARYQRAVQLMTGQGGWPLTAFLTPDGDTFYGGTYFPPEDAYGRPSFRRVLREIARVWSEQPERAASAAREIDERLDAIARAEGATGEPDPELAITLGRQLSAEYDPQHGGFGDAPKFPNAPALGLLLDLHVDGRHDGARDIVVGTLRGMARGGVRDHLGGGFHRYSVDRRWNVPHFEKMAYDNALLMTAYAQAAAALEEPPFGAVAADVVRYYLDIAPEAVRRGEPPASQDADVGPDDDGAYWTWSAHEIRAACEEEADARAAILRWGVDRAESAMPHEPERHVLYEARTIAEVAAALEEEQAAVEKALARAGGAMKQTRDARPQPFVDQTVFTSWSAMLASGFIAAERWGGADGAATLGLAALERLWGQGPADHGLPHRAGDPASQPLLEDQAFAAAAMLDAFEWTQQPEWLERTRTLVDGMLGSYRDDAGAFLDRPVGAGGEGALTRPHRPIVDAPEPSGNAVAALTLLRLHALTDHEPYREAAGAVLRAFAGASRRLGTMATTYARAMDAWSRGATHLLVVASEDDALWHAARRIYLPRLSLRRLDPGATPTDLPAPLAAALSADAPRAYLCVGNSCSAPMASPQDLAAVIR